MRRQCWHLCPGFLLEKEIGSSLQWCKGELTAGSRLLAAKKMLEKVPTSLKSVTSWLTAAAQDGAGFSGEVCQPCSSPGTTVPCGGRADDGAACCYLAENLDVYLENVYV